MKKNVLIIGDETDIHVQSVASHLKSANACVDVLNFGQFPSHVRLSQSTSETVAERFLIGDEEREINFADVSAVWKRRVNFCAAHESIIDPADRASADADTRAFVTGLLYSMKAAGVRFVNDPIAEVSVNSKLYQLEVARSLGCRVPQTVVTNDPSSVRRLRTEMHDTGRRLVYKPLTQTGDRLLATQLLNEEDIRRLDALRLAPAIFQEYCEGTNLRITVVGEQIFAAEIILTSRESLRDWRLEPYHGVRPVVLAAEEETTVRALMKRFELVYGAFDFIRTAKGEFVFLEVNPAGQFLFVEIRAKLQISRAVAEELLREK